MGIDKTQNSRGTCWCKFCWWNIGARMCSAERRKNNRAACVKTRWAVTALDCNESSAWVVWRHRPLDEPASNAHTQRGVAGCGWLVQSPSTRRHTHTELMIFLHENHLKSRVMSFIFLCHFIYYLKTKRPQLEWEQPTFHHQQAGPRRRHHYSPQHNWVVRNQARCDKRKRTKSRTCDDSWLTSYRAIYWPET